MPQPAAKDTPKELKIGAIVNPTVKGEIGAWAARERRSERGQVAALLEKLVALRKSHPDRLIELGLMDRSFAAAG